MNSEPCKHRCWLYIQYVSLAFRKCVWFHYYLFIISKWPVPLQTSVPTNAYWWVRYKQTWDTSVKDNGHYVMALECLCGPLPPQVFSPHHDPIEITASPSPYHMNSCHLLMGGSLGAETSLRDWNVQETSPILLTKCLFIYLFQTV